MSFLAWLAGTRMGRAGILVMAALAAFFYAVARAFSAGRLAEKARQDKAALAARRNRERIDDGIAEMDEHRARAELSRWVRDDEAR